MKWITSLFKRKRSPKVTFGPLGDDRVNTVYHDGKPMGGIYVFSNEMFNELRAGILKAQERNRNKADNPDETFQ